jgi:hypothetical protein
MLSFNFRESHNIGATIFISSLIDTAFDHSEENQDGPTPIFTPERYKSQNSSALPRINKSTNRFIQQLKSQLNLLATAFSSMNDALNFLVHNIYNNLSKFNIVLF